MPAPRLALSYFATMTRRRQARVFQLRILPPADKGLLRFDTEVFDEWGPRIREVIRPSARTTRYGREWIIGQVEEANGIITGRIGFQGEPGTAEVWDEERSDFIETAIPSGMTAPFAIDTRNLTAAIQARNPHIKVNGLVGAFEALLTGAGKRWRLEALRETMSLAEWKRSVHHVTYVRFTIREPNPHYHDARNLEELMSQLSSEVIQLEAQSDNGLDINSPFIVETESHIERGYGDGEYRGLSDAGESLYSTKVGAEEQSELREVDPSTGEVSQEDLRGVLLDGEREENSSHGQVSKEPPRGTIEPWDGDSL